MVLDVDTPRDTKLVVKLIILRINYLVKRFTMPDLAVGTTNRDRGYDYKIGVRISAP